MEIKSISVNVEVNLVEKRACLVNNAVNSINKVNLTDFRKEDENLVQEEDVLLEKGSNLVKRGKLPMVRVEEGRLDRVWVRLI